MAGIAPQDDQAPPEAPPTAQPTAKPDEGSNEVGDEEGLAPNASPEEQQQYKEFVLSGLAMIYDKQGDAHQVRPGILKLLDDDPTDLKTILNAQELEHFSPLVAIAATTVLIVTEIQQLAGDAHPTDEIVLHGSVAILEELAEVWMRRNKQQIGEDEVHKALSMAADIYREVAADKGLIDLNALKDEFGKLVQADKAGKLADISPDLAGVNKAAEINQEQGDEPQPDQQPDQADQPPADQQEPQ